MSEKENLERRNQLANSKEWAEIKQNQLERVLELSRGQTDPLILKGMLLNIADTDRWKKQFETEKNKLEKNKE